MENFIASEITYNCTGNCTALGIALQRKEDCNGNCLALGTAHNQELQSYGNYTALGLHYIGNCTAS